MARYVGKRIVPKHCGYWDQTKAYEMENVVYHQASGNSYISRKAVPAGTDISQKEYWALCSDFNMQMDLLEKHFTATEQRIVADNDATEASIKADNDATEAAVKEDNAATKQTVENRVSGAEAALAQQRAAFEASERQLNTRMDAVLAAGTGDGTTEIVDARVDGQGKTYDSLGAHVRGLTEDQNKKRNRLESKLDRMLMEVRVSNNFLNPERQDEDTWDAEAYKGHYVSVNPAGTISGLTPTEMYSFCGNWDIRGLSLSGKRVVCNYTIRFLSLTKTPLGHGDFHRDIGDCVTILTTTGGASKGTEIQLPEFDESEFPYYDPYYLIKAEYIPDFKTSELVDDVGFVKTGDPVSALDNDAGYLTEAFEKVAITPQNSDRIMILGDSYTESSFTVRGKAYINKLSLFSDYVFENMALSGDIYYGNIDRIRTGNSQYGWSFEEARPKFAMMCCFTNDIKTLTADQYADALRRACEEVIGRGVIPIICTEYHAVGNIPNIVSVNEQVAREYGCPCWDIASIVQIVRGADHAAYWGGSHAGTRPNALQSDNYEKFLQTLERPNHSIKLFRLRDNYSEKDIADLMFHTNEERAELFREICVGHTRLADPAMVDNCTNASTTRENSEYAKLAKGQAVAFPKVALASVVIPGDYRSTKDVSLKLVADQSVQVYVKDISGGNYVRPRRYVRFDFTDAVVNIPAVGDVYHCEDFGNANLTVADIVMGQGDGDAVGYILCSGVPGNNTYNDHGGTLTKRSGTGDATIEFTYKSVGYRAEDLTAQELGGWTEILPSDGEYKLTKEQLSTCIFRDRVDFLIVADGAFNLTGIEADWYGSQSKVYTRKELCFLSNLARDTEEWIEQPTFGEAGQPDTFWNVTPTTASDGCYPLGCSSVVEVDEEHGISLTLNDVVLGLNNKYKSGTAIIEVWARYFPEEYTDGSGDQITEDSYDYAVLKAETGMSNRKASYVTLKERVNTHWKIIQFPIELTGGMYNYGFHLKLYSDKPLQIARVSLKKE